jgi:hypothetical protein
MYPFNFGPYSCVLPTDSGNSPRHTVPQKGHVFSWFSKAVVSTLIFGISCIYRVSIFLLFTSPRLFPQQGQLSGSSFIVSFISLFSFNPCPECPL